MTTEHWQVFGYIWANGYLDVSGTAQLATMWYDSSCVCIFGCAEDTDLDRFPDTGWMGRHMHLSPHSPSPYRPKANVTSIYHLQGCKGECTSLFCWVSPPILIPSGVLEYLCLLMLCLARLSSDAVNLWISLSFLIWWVKNTVIPYFLGQAYKVHKTSCLDKANRYLSSLDSSVFILHSRPSDLLRCKYHRSTPLLKLFQSHANAWRVSQAAFSLLKNVCRCPNL